MLKMVDNCLGEILEILESTSLKENTLVIFCSDHGDLLGEHSLFAKDATFHESEIKIPMMIRFPNGTHAGKQINHLASSIDLVPTLLDYLNIKADISLPGKTLRSMIENNQRSAGGGWL